MGSTVPSWLFSGREFDEERNNGSPIPGGSVLAMIRQRQFWLRYGLAALAVLAAFLTLQLLHGYFEDRSFTVIYVPVIVYAAFAGGAGPALFSTVLCLGSSAFLLR